MGKELYTAKQFIDAIPGTGGIVSTIAERVGCVWHTAKKYIDEYPSVAQAYQDETEKVLDLAESVVLKNIENAAKLQKAGGIIDVSDAKWLLSRKGKSRGYIERTQQEISGAGGGDLVINVKVSDAED